MKRAKNLFALVLSIVLCVTSVPVLAADTEQSEMQITMQDINSTEKKTISISDESVYYPESAQTKAANKKYPIYTRVVKKRSSSSGIQVCSSKSGTYSNIASLTLSFVKGIPAMRISQIFNVVSLVVSSNQYSQAKTFKSYVDYRKDGQARWSNDKAYSTWVMSGRREYYKHVLGAKKNNSGKWTTKTRDYLSSPARVDKGTFYTKNDTWFKEQARQRMQSRSLLDDLPW